MHFRQYYQVSIIVLAILFVFGFGYSAGARFYTRKIKVEWKELSRTTRTSMRNGLFATTDDAYKSIRSNMKHWEPITSSTITLTNFEGKIYAQVDYTFNVYEDTETHVFFK